jgi:hypothetical protein
MNEKKIGNRLFRRTKYTVSPDLLAEYKDFNNSPFASYLTGLIEGDGTIIVPKTERSPCIKLCISANCFSRPGSPPPLSNVVKEGAI